MKPEMKIQNIETPDRPCRVFLVEDDPDDRRLSKKNLERSELVSQVVCFSNGSELIEYMKNAGFQDHSVMCLSPMIIVIDLHMPEMNGFEILKQLKFDLFLQDIPVVVVSGEASELNVRRAYESRADGFFRKPLNIDEIQSFLSRGWQWPTREMWMH